MLIMEIVASSLMIKDKLKPQEAGRQELNKIFQSLCSQLLDFEDI